MPFGLSALSMGEQRAAQHHLKATLQSGNESASAVACYRVIISLQPFVVERLLLLV